MSNPTHQGFTFKEVEGKGDFIVWKLTKQGEFYSFSDPKSFYHYQQKLSPEKRNFHETIQNGKQKPRFDIDINPADLPIMVKAPDVVNYLIKAILSFNASIKLDDLAIYSSNGPDKFSYHLIINNWYHENAKEAKIFYDQVMMQVERKIVKMNVIDKSVYKSMQQFRILGNTKYQKDRPKKREYEWDYYGDKLTWPRLKSYQEYIESLIGYFAEDNEAKHLKLAMEESFSDGGSDVAVANTYVSQEVISKLVPEGYELDWNSFSAEHGYHLKRIRPSHCPVCCRWHGMDKFGKSDSKGDNGRIVIEKGKISFCCFRDPHQKRYLLNVIDSPTVTENAVSTAGATGTNGGGLLSIGTNANGASTSNDKILSLGMIKRPEPTEAKYPNATLVLDILRVGKNLLTTNRR